MNSDLMRFVLREEMCDAVFQLGGNKAPGPEGFNGKFSQDS